MSPAASARRKHAAHYRPHVPGDFSGWAGLAVAFERGHPGSRTGGEPGTGALFQPVGGTAPGRLSAGSVAEETRAGRLAASVWPIGGGTEPVARVRRQRAVEHR